MTKTIKDELGISVYQLVVVCFILAIVILVLIIVNIIGQSRIFKGFVFLYKCYFDNDESNETNETEQPEPEKTTKKGARLMSPRRK
jgi:lipopolysaccharide export LptBFGC system permease protein LptF